MQGNLAGRPSTFSMHVSFKLAILLLVIYSTDVLVKVCLDVHTRMFPTGLFVKMTT